MRAPTTTQVVRVDLCTEGSHRTTLVMLAANVVDDRTMLYTLVANVFDARTALMMLGATVNAIMFDARGIDIARSDACRL